MGKNLTQQKRGKGSSRYRAPSFRYAGEAKHSTLSDTELKGKITDIVDSQGHSAPLLAVTYDNGKKGLMQAPEGVKVGDSVITGANAEIAVGNTVALKNIPEGTQIYNIESFPGDGGKFVRSSGTFARVLSKVNDRIQVELPSQKHKDFTPECRATIGIVSGGGRPEKPFLKAGNKFFAMKAKNKVWPITSGMSMNAVAHPWGSKGSHTKGRPFTVSRNAPPGRKVGLIAARRTGRKKK